MSRFEPRATQVLTPIDGGKLAAASGQKSLNSRNSCSTSCCTQCQLDIKRFYVWRQTYSLVGADRSAHEHHITAREWRDRLPHRNSKGFSRSATPPSVMTRPLSPNRLSMGLRRPLNSPAHAGVLPKPNVAIHSIHCDGRDR
jgi:hypothetical protein